MGGKFKFSAQDRDLEYFFQRSKNLSVSSDINPPLVSTWISKYWLGADGNALFGAIEIVMLNRVEQA